jgi:hypothetical protein
MFQILNIQTITADEKEGVSYHKNRNLEEERKGCTDTAGMT